MRWRHLVTLVIMVSAGCATTAVASPGGAGGDVVCRTTKPARAVVLYFHPGSFYFGATSAYLRARCPGFTKARLEVLAVDYPVRDLPGAVAHARSSARKARSMAHGRAVLAYGESAGGTLAEDLAVEHVVDGAAAVAAPSDLLTWGGDDFWTRVVPASLDIRRRASPVSLVRSPSPVLLLHSPSDGTVPFTQSTALLSKLPNARLVRLDGDHLADLTARRRAISWFVRGVRSWLRPRQP